jgi:hypothetical protein
MPDRVGYTNVRCILNLDGPSRVHKCTMYTKFWSRYDLQNFRKRIFLGDGQGELSKGTVVCRSTSVVVYHGTEYGTRYSTTAV